MSDAVLFEARRDGIAVVTLNRPESRNALGKDIRECLFAAWSALNAIPTCGSLSLQARVKKPFAREAM
jgi:enoyl-CoA hydratase